MPKIPAPKEVTSYTHPAPDAVPQAADPRPGNYYVTAIDKEMKRVYPVSGPYPMHQPALDMVLKTADISQQLNPRAAFWEWGTTRVNDPEYVRPGILQQAGYSLECEPPANPDRKVGKLPLSRNSVQRM